MGEEVPLERTAPQAAFGISIKFVPSSSGLTPDFGRVLFCPSVEEGLSHEFLLLSAKLRTADGSIKMDLRRDEESILRQNVWTSY